MFDYDAIVHKLQNTKDFTVFKIDESTGMYAEDFLVTTQEILSEVVIDESNLGAQIDLISAQIRRWSQLSATANRIVDITKRCYRVWRESTYLSVMEEGKSPGGGKLTIAVIDKMVRVDPMYTQHYIEQEKAAERFHMCEGVLDALKAKKLMLDKFVRKSFDGSESLQTI